MATDPRRRPAPPPPPPPPPPESPPQDSTNGTDEAHTLAQDTASTTAASQEGGFKLKFCTVCASNNNRSMEAHLRLTTAPEPYPTISFGTGSFVRLPGPSATQPNVYNFNSTSYNAMYSQLASKDRRLYLANGILPMLERNKNVKWGPERWQDWKIGVPRVGKRWHAGVNTNVNPPPTGQETVAHLTADLTADDADYAADHGAQGTEAGTVDVVITCEDRCWEAVVDDLLFRGSPLNRPVHVFNVDIKDNHEDALVGGRAILDLADVLNAAAREERLIAPGGVNGFDAGHAASRRGFDERVPDILAAWQEKWQDMPALWTLAWF